MAGLTVEGFWDLDPHETHIAIRAYHRRCSYEDDARAWYAHILFNTQVEKKKDARKPAELKRLPPLDKAGDRGNAQADEAEGGQRKRTEAEEREAFRRLKENRRRHNVNQRATR